MSNRDQKTFYTKLVWVFIVIAAIGVGVLIYESIVGQSSAVIYSLVVFTMTIAALIMTTLQGISANRQMKLTESILRKTNQSNRNMEQLVEEDRQLAIDIRKDMALDQAVVSILEEYGIGSNEKERNQVAKRLAQLSKKH